MSKSACTTRQRKNLDALKSVYPADEAFKSAFADKIIRTTNSRNLRIVRYILCALERQLNQTEHDFDSDTFSIEHVLPQNPGVGWSAFSDEEVEAMTYRIGNMALMAKGANKDIGNAAFAVKKPVLANSRFELTRKMAEDNADWTPERIAARQKYLARLASTVWRVAQLSD
jgi:hypothetical protein